MGLNKEISFGHKNKKAVGKVPTKKSINLIVKKKSDIRPLTVIPSVLIICVLAALLSKVAVVDLLTDLNRAQGRVSTVQTALDAVYAEIDSLKDLEEKYYHYTYSGLNQTELTTVSRGDILSLLQEKVIPSVTLNSWSVSYNTVSLRVTAETLQDVNNVVQILRADDRVDYCSVNSASGAVQTIVYTDAYGRQTETVIDNEDTTTVTAQVTITMKDVLKGVFKG